MKLAKDKDYWLRVGLGLVMTTGIAAALVWWWLNHSLFADFTRTEQRLAVSSTLYSLGAAGQAYFDAHGCLAADWDSLAPCGFRPLDDVLISVTVIDLDWGGGRLTGFWAEANHGSGSEVFGYNSFSGTEVKKTAQAEPLRGQEYAVRFLDLADTESRSGARLAGPPFLVFSVPLIWTKNMDEAPASPGDIVPLTEDNNHHDG